MDSRIPQADIHSAHGRKRRRIPQTVKQRNVSYQGKSIDHIAASRRDEKTQHLNLA